MNKKSNNFSDTDIDNTNAESSSNLFIKIKDFSNSWTGTIIIVLIIIFFVAQAFVIPSGSMKRTLLIGDHLFVKKFAYGIPTPTIPWIELPVLPDFDGDGHLIAGDKPKKGDIVVFRYPKNPKIHFVKRCVATEGDTVMLRDKKLYIHPKDGVEKMHKEYPKAKIVTIGGIKWIVNPYRTKFPGIQNDPFVVDRRIFPRPLFELPPTLIKPNHFFMMGDNRDHSNDSRFWGQVPYKYIEGTPWFIYFSWDKNYEIRWKRIGAFVKDLEVDKSYIDMSVGLGSGEH